MAKVNKPAKLTSLDEIIRLNKIDQVKENEGGGAINKILGSAPEQGVSHQSTYKPIAPSETQTMFDEGYISEEVRNSGEFSLDDLHKIAAREQGFADSFMQASQRVALNIVPQIVGGFASMVDIPGYFDAEHGATNSIVNAVADWEEYVNKDIAPIYRENPNKSMDFGDSAWWFENGAGLATSVGSFLAQGMGAGAIVKGAGMLAKASKVGGLAKLGMSAKNIAGVSQGTSALATATMLNQSESTISATQVYNSTMDHWLNEGYSAEHAKKQAATAAATTYNINRANILLNLSSANLFLQPMSLTRQLLKPGSIGSSLMELGKEAGQEGLEEIINTVGEQAGKAHGKGEKYGMKELGATITSPEAMEAALLGAVGGIVQTGGQKLMRNSSSKYSSSSTLDAEGNRISANQFEKNRYNEQQKIIQSMEENGVAIGESFTNMKKQLNLQHDIQNAKTQEQYNKAQQELFTTTALNAFQSGTTEVLENLIRASKSNEDAVGDKGITDEHVKQGIAKLKILENVYNNYEGYSNLSDIFYNRANSINATQNLEQSTNDSMKSRTELDSIAKSVAAKHPFVKTDEVLVKKDGVVDPSQTYTRDTKIPINYSVTDLGNNTGDTEVNRKIYDEFLAEVSKTNTFHEHNANELRKDSDAEMVRKLDEDLLNLKSPKAQEEYNKKQEAQAKRDVDKKVILDDKSSIADLEKIASESKDADIKNAANEAIAEKKAEQTKVIQKKKDNDIYNKHAFNIVKSTDTDELDSIGSDISNSTEISEDVKSRLLQSIDRRKFDLENGTTLSDEAVETSNNDLEDIDIADKSTNSSLPTDFNSTEIEKNIIEEVEKLAKKIIENEQSPLVSEKGGVVWQYGKTTEGHNKGAYQGRNFVQINGNGVVTREEITNELNDVNPDILNPDKLKPGHKIKLVEDFDYDGMVYDSTSTTKGEVKWSDRKKQIANDSEALQNETPIVAIDISTGKKLFYVHDINWMTAENIDSTPEELHNDIQALKAVRAKVLASGSEGIETKIDKKTSGILFKTADNKSIALSEAMPDEKLIMVVGKDGGYIGTNIENDKIIGSDNIKDGYGYAIVPVGDKFMAVPLERTTLSPEVVETVVQAVQAYLLNDEKIVQAIAGSTGDDISTLKGLSNYLRKFTYLFPIQGNSSLKNVIANSTKDFNSSNHLLSVTGNSIEFGKPSVTGSFRSISKNTPTEKIDELLSKLREHLTGSLSNIEKVALQKKENISTINENGDLTTLPYRDHIKQSHKTNVLSAKIETENGDKYVYTYQQGITFDTTFAPIEKRISVTSQVSNNASQNEIESKAQTIAININEYSIDRLLAQIKDLEEGHTNEFQENFLTPVTDSEVADLIAVRKRAIAIRNEQVGKPVIPVKRTLSDGEIFEIKEGDVDISDNDLDEYADDLPTVSEGTKDALSNALNNLQIKGLSTDHQQSLINYISSTINTEAIKLKEKDPKGKLDTTPIFEQKKKALEERAEMYRNSNQPNKAAKIDLIVSQFDKVKKLTNEHIKLMTTGKVSDTEVQDESSDPEEISGGNENTTHSDDWTLTTDSKMTASVEVKQFLGFIEHKENGLTKVNDLGFPEVILFDEAYNTLHEILQGLPADYEQIENRLTAYTEFFPWIQTIIEKLDDAPDNVKNGFVSDMTKHAIKMRFVMWTQNPNGTYSLVDQDANSTSIQKQLVAHWSNNLKTADNPRSIVTVDKDGNHVFDKEKAELIVKQAEEWKENIKETTPDIESVIGWLKAFGIVLNPRTIKDLQDGKFRNNGKISYTGLFNQSTGLINVLSGKLKSAVDSNATLEDVKILNDSVIKSLAMMNALYESNVFSNSFNAGGKTIYSFTNNKFVVNRVRDLSATDAEGNLVNTKLIEDLQNISFTQHSLWLKDLTSEDKALATAFREQFGVDYLSLEALKKQFTSSKDNRKLNNLNEDEHEVIKLALFFNNSGTIYDGETRRKVSYFYPTMSDKSSMMIMNSLSNEVSLNEDGSLSDKSLDKLYEALVLPEIQRIVSKQATTINGYTPNAFYFVPTLNTKTVEVGEENKTILEYIKEGRLDEVRGDVQEEVKVLFEKLLADKKADWERLGIGKIDKDGHSFLSGDYMLNVAKGTKESKINYAASDFLFNSLISNSEAFKLIIGDPAQYSKFKNGKSIEANLEESFINIGKRLAGDIAPGVELANAENNKYYQVFLNDKKLASKAYDNKIQEALSPEVKAKYSSMEGSDAQEYTTWKEHLYVMKQLGKLTDLQFKRISDRLTQGLGLSFEDLQTVLQPMKPVYVGNQADRNENIDRRIYIKSSSFPLIPQLTKGLEIDKIRIGLEDFENSNQHGATVRASFNTANKVGLIKDSVDVFDDNGNVIDGFAVTESNTLYLDRKNFRIQQEVPYNHEKEAVNIGTQERKLLFNNILDMEGFKLDDKKHTGESLKEVYDQTYKEMFEYKKKQLSERLGITDSGNIPVTNLRDILVAEVTSRQGYPLNILSSLELNNEGTDFKIPLWASPYAEKFESLLTGVINNGIIKQKFNGHSYILGSEEGFKIKEDATEEDFSQSGIVFTDSFDAKKGLQPMRFDSNGKLLPAQIMIPFNFKNKDKEGNKLSLKDFTKIVDGKKVIDLDKIDPKILQLFGFRIPTQGHNSMSTVEIVGFLPEESGDLMLAPRDFTVQMGSDFDVDKMYTYMYNVQLQDGKLITEFENGEIENLQNKVLDIHHSVLANTNPEMVRFILAPDSFGEFEKLAADVYDARKKSGKVENTVTILSDSYQRTKYINATAGKDGCLGFGTKVLMFNGKFKEVQDIIIGDQLMGIDSSPRNVLELKRGVEQMYIVKQNRGIDYRVNESHILSLKQTFGAQYHQPQFNKIRTVDKSILLKPKRIETLNIKVSDYNNSIKNLKKTTKGYKSEGINFKEQPLLIDPYYIGLWLGDGVTKDIQEIATVDLPIRNYLDVNYGIKSEYGPNNISKRVYSDKLNENFKLIYNVNKSGLKPGCKYIPDSYLYNTRENRLKLLAGLIDSDGHYCKINKQYTFSNINKTLIDQVTFLTRSLGFYTCIYKTDSKISKRGLNEQVCYKVNFVAECDIPVLLERKKRLINSKFKNKLHTGIVLEKDIVDNYYGFVLDGDHLFMLEDLTITHNTGNFSLDSTFNAIIQGKDLVYYEGGIEEKRPETHAELIAVNLSKFTFGNITSRGDLSNKYTLKSQALLKRGNLTKEEKLSLKLKSSVIQGLQSSAVDNEKAQILDKLNINSNTFDVIRAMAQLGFEENEIVGLLTQDIIWEYVSAMKSSNSSLVGFDPNASETFRRSMKIKYDPNGRMVEKSFKYSEYNKDSGIDLLNKLSTSQLIVSNETLDSNVTQLVLLDKFLDLAGVGVTIKTVQSAINTESSGLPKNLLETSSKVDQINKLESNLIVNASTLLGNYSDNGKLIEPTTINGFAAYHGAIFANQIYAKYFPYTKFGFNKQYKELLEHQNASEGSQSKLIDVKVAMYKEMKSFFYTKSNLGLYDGSLLSEQKRLFIDGTDNKSLASILSTLSEKKWFKNNNFLNKLSFDVNQNGLASKVNFVASAGKNYDERSIYIGFLKLLDDDASIGSFNGSEYTTRSLAQDLIAYSYLEGGQQGAKQFLKYVPVEYLKGMGFGEGLNSVEFHYEDDFGGNGGVYTTPSKFTTQYFQNNPEKAKKIDVSEIKNYDGKIDTLNSFELSNLENNFVYYFSEAGDRLETQTQFVSIYDAKLKGKYALYQFDTQNQMYKKVQVLSGQYGFRQYNASDNILMAVQPAIEKVIPQIVELGVPTPGATQDLSDLFKTTEHTFTPDAAHISSPIEKLGDIEVDVKANGDVAIKGLLNSLSESKTINPYLKSLADAYSKLNLPSEIKLKITEEGGRGMWNYKKNQLDLNKEELKDTSVDEVATTVLHELTHTFTSESIKKWRENPNSVTTEQKVAINKLEGLRKKYENHLNKEGRGNDLITFGVAYEAWVLDKTKSATFDEKDLSELYGAYKLEDFVTMAQTDVKFQHILNNIIDDNGKTMLSKLLDELMNIMNSLLKTVGVDLKEDSLLRNTLVEINNLITVNQNIIVKIENVDKLSNSEVRTKYESAINTITLDEINNFLSYDNKKTDSLASGRKWLISEFNWLFSGDSEYIDNFIYHASEEGSQNNFENYLQGDSQKDIDQASFYVSLINKIVNYVITPFETIQNQNINDNFTLEDSLPSIEDIQELKRICR